MGGKVSNPDRILEPFHFNKMYGSVENDDAVDLLKDGGSIRVFSPKVFFDEDSVRAKKIVENTLK